MKWLHLVMRIGPLVVAAVHAIERVVKGPKGKEKQDAAVAFLMHILAATETGLNRDLLDDAAVQDAVRKAIDAIVAVENVLAARAATAPRAPSTG